MGLLFPIVAVAAALVHLLRHRDDRDGGTVAEIFLLWWLVIMIGLASFLGGLGHLFDGPDVADEIGYTRGDGGFQTEVGFADLALGFAGMLCFWFRDRFWLAVVVIAAISLLGYSYGHIYQMVENDNHEPGNTGLVLWIDIATPLVAIALYAIRERARRRAAGTARPT
jgi:hypothetical protein